MIELVDKFDLPGLKIWLQLLSIGDRNDGEIRGNIDWICKSFLYLFTSNSRRYGTKWRQDRCKMTLEWMQDKHWISIKQEAILIVNHLKYHRSREQTESPPNQTEPSSYSKKNTQTSLPLVDPDLCVKDLVESWNESFKGKLPVVEWPLSSSRAKKAAMRLREHRALTFWQRVFNNINSSPFLLGANNGSWRCTLDFIIANDSNCVKIYEGAYHGKNQRA